MPTRYEEAGRDGYASGYDAQRAALARRRRLAQLLQERSMEAAQGPTHGNMSWLAPIAQMAQAYAGKSMEEDAAAESKKLASEQDAAFQQALADFPTGEAAIPAQEMGPPSPDAQVMPKMVPSTPNFGPQQQTLGSQLAGPAAPMGGMLPQVPQQMPSAPQPPPEPAGMQTVPGEMSSQPAQAATPPSIKDLMSYAARVTPFGGVGAKVGEHAAELGVSRMFPKPPSEEFILAQERYRNEAADRRAQAMESLRIREEDSIRRSQDTRATAAERAAAQREGHDLKLQIAKMADATARMGIEARRDAAGDRAADKADKANEKALEKGATEYGKVLTKEKIPQLDMLLGEAETMVASYPDAAEGGGIPGIGGLKNIMGGVFLSPEGAKNQQTLTGLRRLITTSEAGLSQTQSEMRGVLQNLGLTPLSTTAQFLQAIPTLRRTLEARKATIRGTYSPAARKLFDERSGGGEDRPPLSKF